MPVFEMEEVRPWYLATTWKVEARDEEHAKELIDMGRAEFVGEKLTQPVDTLDHLEITVKSVDGEVPSKDPKP